MISRFRRYARERGHRAAIAKAADEVKGQVYSRARMTILLKELDQIPAPRRSSGVAVVPLVEGHLAGLAELNRARGKPGVDRRFRGNLRRGLRGFVGLRDGATVGYYWWIDAEGADSHPDLEWLGNCVQIGPGDVYGSDFYVLPEHRPGGTANDMLFQVESHLREMGFERLWGYIVDGSREARWLYSSRGYRPMEEVHSRRLLFHRQRARPRK
jgi:GNAT superfamily N-acetyltransferase